MEPNSRKFWEQHFTEMHTYAIAIHFLIEIPSTVFSTAFALKDDSDESEETEDFVGVFLVVL